MRSTLSRAGIWRRARLFIRSSAHGTALEFARLTGNKELAADLIKRFQLMLTSAESALIPDRRHVDEEIFGILPLEVYLLTHEEKYLKIGLF